MVSLNVSSFEDIESAREYYLREIDRAAEARRMQFITPGDGQALTYSAKYAEAAVFMDGGNGPFPWLESEAGSTGTDVATIAQSIVKSRQEWEAVGRLIETQRIKCKQHVRELGSSFEMLECLAEFRRSLPPAPERYT